MQLITVLDTAIEMERDDLVRDRNGNRHIQDDFKVGKINNRSIDSLQRVIAHCSLYRIVLQRIFLHAAKLLYT